MKNKIINNHNWTTFLKLQQHFLKKRTYTFSAGVELVLDSPEHAEYQLTNTFTLLGVINQSNYQKVKQVILVHNLSHQECEAFGCKITDILLSRLAEQRWVELIDIVQVLEHVAPQELEEKGERLERPLDNVRVLSVE